MPSTPMRVSLSRRSLSPGKGTSLGAHPATLAGPRKNSTRWAASPSITHFPPIALDNSKGGPWRIQSAVYGRPQVSSPNRHVKSAGLIRVNGTPSYRPPSSLVASRRTSTEYSQGPQGQTADHRRSSPSWQVIKVRRPPTPITTSKCERVEAWAAEEPLVSYEEQLKKHGWRMEVPGDPFMLKRPCLSARIAYTEQIIDPDNPPPLTERQPPQPVFKRNGWGTYFLNTIPKHLATVDIHPEFFSEFVNAKRLALHKRSALDMK